MAVCNLCTIIIPSSAMYHCVSQVLRAKKWFISLESYASGDFIDIILVAVGYENMAQSRNRILKKWMISGQSG